MFRIVGWLVVTGFALYGANIFVKNHVVAHKSTSLRLPPITSVIECGAKTRPSKINPMAASF